MTTQPYTLFGQAYGSGAYSSSAYSGSSTGTSTGAGGGSLSNTGIAVAGIVTIAAVILLIAMVVRVWRRPVKQAVLEPVDDDEQQANQ